MARILDKLLPGGADKAMKLRQSYELTKAEYAALDEKYEAKKAEKMSAFIKAANKKLAPLAYEACDKSEYAESVMAEKLKKYDVSKYLSHREVNHKAAKAIFDAIKAEKDWSGAISEMKSSNEKLLAEREAYVTKLEAEKKAFVAKNLSSDSSRYDVLRKKLEAERAALSETLDAKYDAEKKKEAEKLEKKIASLEAALELEKQKKAGKASLPEDVILSVKGLKMYFGGLRAVDDLTFDVKKGEIFGLIGPNGAGKTTVFNCITQFYKPTAGELLFTMRDGETISLTDYKVHDIVLKGISRTFQNVEVVKEVSVLDNLLIAATRHYTSNLFVQMLHLPLLKKEEKMIRAKAEKVLKYMDLLAYRDRLAWGLPYGVLKKIEIARALMCDPQLIILDEPAAGLNESETSDLAELINKIRKDFDCTVLLVEHDMSLVMNVCDHICAISFGKKLAYGTPEEVQASKEVQEAYLGVGED